MGQQVSSNTTKDSRDINIVNRKDSNPNQNNNIMKKISHEYMNQQQNQQSQQKNNRPQPPKRNFKGSISSSLLRDLFHSNAIDGKYLNKDRFNDTLEKIFSPISIPRLHYTYLSSKIYEFLDEVININLS